MKGYLFGCKERVMQVSIVNYSRLEELTSRLDAEYYRPIFLNYERTLKRKSYTFLGEEGKFIIGPFGSSFLVENYDLNSSYRYVRGKDVKSFLILDNDNVYIPEEDFRRLSKYALKNLDILISVVGTLGNASIVNEEVIPAIFSCKSTAFRSNGMNEFYLVTYLNCKFGQSYLQRNARGTVQTGLNIDDLKSIPIFRTQFRFEELVGRVVEQSLQLLKKSKEYYTQAEQILLSELGLPDWQPKHQLSFVKNFSDAQESERIDAEYFQPKYDEIINTIKSYKGGWDRLGNLVNIKKCIEPGSNAYQDSGIPFVRVSNLSKFEITDNNQQYIAEKLYRELIEHQPKQNEILLSKDATPGIAYYLRNKPGRMICSSGILRLTIKNHRRISTADLTLMLNSTIVQQQILRDAGGSIINHWRLDQIRNTVVPILSEESQREIQSKIELAFNQVKPSKHLLEIAKRGVEMAIGQDEKTAEEWINQNIPLAIERGEHLT